MTSNKATIRFWCWSGSGSRSRNFWRNVYHSGIAAIPGSAALDSAGLQPPSDSGFKLGRLGSKFSGGHKAK